MEKISYNLVFNRKKRLNKRGMALVQVEAYLNRKKMYFSTKINLQITWYSQNFKLNATFLFAFSRKKQKEWLLKVFYD